MVAGSAPGADSCASCHPAQSAAHERSNHARTLRRALETEFARSLPDRPIGEARGGFLLTYSRSGGGLEVTAERGRQIARARIEWIIGAGDQGLTPLTMFEGRWLEHRISYYTKPARFDLTLGHRPGPSATAAAALGAPQSAATMESCLGCHSTVGKALAIVTPGIECERCHPGASAHARGATAPPKKPANRVETCASCHRLTAPNGNEADPLNVRFQPLRLIKSKCYLSGGITCNSCHTPHENARRANAAYYEARCAACHAQPHRPDGCLTCHMPKSTPAPYLSFTDHYIRAPPRP